ncbi:Laminin B2 [Carabus blaptoides fortunei]
MTPPCRWFLVISVLQTVFWCSAQDLTQTPVLGISQKGTKCYDGFNRPQRCIPEFENAAFNVLMEATNTCGDEGAVDYCVQTGASSVKKSCDVCEPDEHDSRFLTDLHNQENQTWWQSETMYEGIQYPSQVNLTLNLRKAFDITYVRIWFYSPRPESFAIYKRTREDGPWIPYQFYSATCRDTYYLPDKRDTAKGEETRALCTSEYSDISPLRDGNVAFSTLEGRPSAYNFDSSPELQEWVTATDIRITLDRLNTFGDEVFGDQQVLRSYFYAIADVAVGARCKCNGHASECVSSTGIDGLRRRVCLCEHHTAGPDCNECEPFYNDVPWGRAHARDAHECKPCNCNGFSNRCFFDKDLYNRTGHGGHCLDCSANRDGPNCERCKENYYQREDHYCVACNCDAVGSRSLQCNREGRCQCKPGVTGDKCDRCDVNHYDFSAQGCKNCGCSEAGSRYNRPTCDPLSGVCHCKENVEGKRCKECKPGYFNLNVDNEFGCTPCFCYGHSSECSTAAGYSQVVMESMFARTTERWSGQDERGRPISIQYHGLTQTIGASSDGYETLYFLAPDRFLGNQRASYNRNLKFTLRIGENGPNPTSGDIILESGPTQVTNTIFAQNNQLPSVQNQQYVFKLHEHPDYGWHPRLSARAFMSILTNLTAIKIRATYTPHGVGFLDDVQLESANRVSAGAPATWVERCTCPQGYVGQFCESCAPGYRHSPALGGPFMPCIPCDCNKHSDICESETGRCICQHNTAGDNCELCARGFYGNALEGSPNDCKPCQCPGGGACMLMLDDTLVCLECPEGYAGPRCDLCSDGYFGDPTGKFGAIMHCRPCDCNQNVDRNAVGNCNRTSGDCLKCIHNTGGAYCDQCLAGYYGDALALPKGDCKPCKCYRAGTEESAENGEPVCDQTRGNCKCRPNVKGHNCDQCEDGYYNIMSGEGCQPCNCDGIGSINGTCDLFSGQCYCQPGITGLRCDQCETYKYGFSSEGCRECECDRIGSKSLQCHATTGQCPCLDNVEGRKCDRCKENKFDRKRGCIDCPACYNLVQEEANRHLAKLQEFERKLNELNSSAIVISDHEFDEKLKQVQRAVEDLVKNARLATGSDDKTLLERLNSVRERQRQVSRILEEVEESMQVAEERGLQGLRNVTEAGNHIDEARKELNHALEVLRTDGATALQNAQTRAKEFGQHSETMTKMSLDARERADDLEKHAQEIENIAKKARNISSQAQDMYKQIQEDQLQINNDVNDLENKIEQSGHDLAQVEASAKDALDRATEAENSALGTLNDVHNLRVPAVNISVLRVNADATRNESLRLLNATNQLIDGNVDLLANIREQNSVALDLLEQGREQQIAISDLLSEADLAHSIAENAVNLGDQTLNEAKETYNTLAGFDREVQASKNSAQEALKQIPEIQRIIDEARNKTDNAKLSLEGARKNAQIARDIVVQAQKEFAEPASEKTEEIRLEADKMRNTAGKLRDEAENLAGRVTVTGHKLKGLEKQITSNGSIIDNAKKMVNQANTESKDASEKVAKVMTDVQSIIDELSGLTDIEPDHLAALEKKLRMAEERLKAAKLKERMERLEKERIEQTTLIKNYKTELERLKAEVENVEAIMKALPLHCIKTVTLEP